MAMVEGTTAQSATSSSSLWVAALAIALANGNPVICHVSVFDVFHCISLYGYRSVCDYGEKGYKSKCVV